MHHTPTAPAPAASAADPPTTSNRLLDEIAVGDRAAIKRQCLTSRADSRESRLASCALASLVAHRYRRSPP